MTNIEQAKEVLQIEAEGITALIDQLTPDFDLAVDFILNCPTRLIITGIGKSGIIGQKIAATLNSTGTPSLFLHPVEAMHGDLGIVAPTDVILAISYSGETTELNALLPTLKKRGVKTIAITGNPESSLARSVDASLNGAIPREACPLGLAPTASTTAALALGDALAVVLINKKHFAASDFKKNHPGGSLGERLKTKVSEVMITGNKLPIISPDTPFKRAMEIISAKKLGAGLICQDEELLGIITDGDIRRHYLAQANLSELTAQEVMTPSPKTISQELLAADALSVMQNYEVTALPVTTNGNKIIGLLHLHSLLGKGEFRLLV